VEKQKYNFKTPPYEHQRKALELGWSKESFAYFMEMGTVRPLRTNIKEKL